MDTAVARDAHRSFAAAPDLIDGPSAWLGPDLATDPSAWLISPDARDWQELDDAVRRWADSGRALADITAGSFPLPRLSRRIARAREGLLRGVGFFLIRGFRLDRYSIMEAAIAYLGVGAQLGSFRSQNARGHLLGHVTDLGRDIADPGTRYYQTNRGLEFHTDSCDVVGLLCLRGARSGGESRLVSSVTIYNRIRTTRPDLCEALFLPFPTDRRGEVPRGMDPWFEMPVFHWHQGLLTTIYVGQYIRSAQALFPQAPRLSDRQLEAIDLIDRIANDPAVSLSMDFQPGDMQFLHNHQLLHAREDFEDWPQPERRRHLLRLWLAPEDARPLPPVFALRYGDLTAGARGGIITPDTLELTFAIEP
ncbi:MAG: TauD/TfdA family dioxygenase [Burkholderiaceae bacterium]